MADQHPPAVPAPTLTPVTEPIPAAPEEVPASLSDTDFADYVNQSSFMQEGSWIVVQMPSSNTKIVQLKGNTTINLGKFGNFRSRDLVGMPFDMPYEIHGDKEVKPATDLHSLDAFDIETEEGASNKDLIDRRESQRLSQFEIEEMKKQSLKGGLDTETMIKALLENSDTFDNKTEFAKAKYIKRKQKKYSKIFIPRRPSARTLCNHFSQDNPRKINEMRIDTLSQMLTTANIRPNGRYIVIDEAGGLLTCALAERLQGRGTIFVIHDHDVYNADLVKYLNFPADLPNVVRTLAWTRLEKNGDEDFETMTFECPDPDKIERLRKRVMRIRKERTYLQAGGFDGLLVISQYKNDEIIQRLAPYLAGSSPVVAYSVHKETLTPTFTHLRTSPSFTNAQLTESWLREYQVLAGTHPMMRMSGSGGYLVSALVTRVQEGLVTHAATSRYKGGKRKGGEEGGRGKKRRGEEVGQGPEGEGYVEG
ncbi:Gcd10p family-domain-containing protein [Fimicolochytrium jonesii]|uniref:Gcd10p family-domain-containing protein n=1 Tax=Fimicolochytrium jonesii TaxID=1396493 RepID=UPI0022FDDA4D|nr:Gcd10p family-domain-containing protein [Fimicolochytrium jonesii]KAI8815891.1 Gcd10p family-domain-containing protein [Fimicolochytrium jonesii]